MKEWPSPLVISGYRSKDRMVILKLGVFVGSWFTIIKVIAWAFGYAERRTSTDLKSRVSGVLSDSSPSSCADSWNTTFPEVFDSVFGVKPLSLQFFFRSCSASYLAASVLTAIWFVTRTEIVLSMRPSDLVALAILLTFFAAFNLIPDWLSLLETRVIIRWMANAKSSVAVIGLLIADVVATGIIIALFLLVPTIGKQHPIDGGMTRFWLDIVTFGGGLEPYKMWSIHFYTTFLTSLWLWLYAIATILIRVLRRFEKSSNWLHFRFLKIDEEPLRVIGSAVNVLVTILWLAVVGPLVFLVG